MSKPKFSTAAIAMALALVAASATAGDRRATSAPSSYGVAVVGPTVPAQTVDVSKLQRSHVNVRCGDVVVFRNGDRSFAWKFDVIGHRAIDLAKIAPQGFSTKPLKVYVASNDFETS